MTARATVERVLVFVEERSMEEAIRALLSRVLGGIAVDVRAFSDKLELLDEPKRLAALATWLPASWRVIVLVDRDRDDCRELKRRLDEIARRAGLACRGGGGAAWQLVNRVVIEELEAWYFGDWEAVRAAYPRVGRTVPRRAAFRDPDAIADTWEALERVLQEFGYYQGARLPKIEVARRVAVHLDPARNRSRSFGKLREVLDELAGRSAARERRGLGGQVAGRLREGQRRFEERP